MDSLDGYKRINENDKHFFISHRMVKLYVKRITGILNVQLFEVMLVFNPKLI